LFPSRREVLKSLSRSALVLSLDAILSRVRTGWLRAFVAGQKADQKEATPQPLPDLGAVSSTSRANPV
jgi:hypothetical protein